MRGRGTSALPAVVLVTLLAATGCGGDDPPPAPPPPPPAAPGAPADPGQPLAADGPNVGACLDGTCEVRVGGPVTLPLNKDFGVSNLRVEGLSADEVRLAGSYPGGSVQADSCSIVARGGSGGRMASFQATCSAGSRLTLERLTIEVLSVNRDVAVIRIAPA